MAARIQPRENEVLVPQEHKRCSKCRCIKLLAQFHRDKSNWSGFASLCRVCNTGHAEDYYQKHRTEILTKSRARWLSRYGLTEFSYFSLQESQQFQCKICRSQFINSKAMHIDHCHRTGKIRGLLCSGCNQALGMVHEDKDTLRAMIQYLSQYE